MDRFEIFDVIDHLRGEDRAFCLATVVRTADVTSAKAGAKVAVTAEGEIIGHLGGTCVQSAVRTAAADALATGQARMIRVKPSEKVVSMQDSDGVELFKSGCPSGGTVDILIEPYRRPPQIAIFGATPIATAIMLHARLLGFRVAMEGAGQDGVPGFSKAGLATLALSTQDFAVVASQGRGDLEALRIAVNSAAGRVSMIASRKKAATLMRRLEESGIPPDRLARVKSPAGIDLGGVDPHEIAVSVLAEIIRWRNAARRRQAAEAT